MTGPDPQGPVLVAWASKTGRTETLAQRIAEVLEAEGLPVELKAVKDVRWDDLPRWRALVLGSPTYGAGDLHPDWDKPERALRDLSLAGWKGAAFGCGSVRYQTAFWAADILENRLKNGGALLLAEAYKAEAAEGLRVRDVDGWAARLAAALNESP